MATLPYDVWRGNVWPTLEVAGSFFYQESAAALFPRRFEEYSSTLETDALLIPEPSNPHDANAVRVEVNGLPVGHLPQETAAAYASVIGDMATRGLTPRVRAQAWGAQDYDSVWDDDGNEHRTATTVDYHVRLALPEPHMLEPANRPPAGPHAMLPFGRSVQVSRDDETTDRLAPWVHPAGTRWLYATLHEYDQQLARTSRTVVEVRVDGQRIGQMTPKMSEDFLPVIRSLDLAGLVCAVRALLKGNLLKADLTVLASRSGELSSAGSNRSSNQHFQRTRWCILINAACRAGTPIRNKWLPSGSGTVERGHHEFGCHNVRRAISRKYLSRSYKSIRFHERLGGAGINAIFLVSRVLDLHDNALAETTLWLYRTELIKPEGPSPASTLDPRLGLCSPTPPPNRVRYAKHSSYASATPLRRCQVRTPTTISAAAGRVDTSY